MAARPIPLRRKVLGAALALTLLASGLIAAGDDDPVAEPTRPAPARAARTTATRVSAQPDPRARIRLERLPAQRNAEVVNEAFTAHSWYVAPPVAPPPPAAPAPAPEAPPQPFAYSGKMLYDGKVQVFITHEGRTFPVQEGDLVDGNYRIDSIKGPLMSWTYLPLNVTQSMHIGEQN